MKKKAEMTTEQIVVLIILIVSFIIILFFLSRLSFGSENEKDICRNSVVVRGSSVVPTDSVSLDCTRSYICLTKDGTCEKASNPIKLKVKTKDEVYDVLAKDLSDCWWMYGEGKVNYIGKDVLPNLYCSMCSQIFFDDSVKEIFGSSTFSKGEFFNYLALTNMSGSEQTYSQYLYSTNDIQEIMKKLGGSSNMQIQGFGSVDLDKTYYSLTAITSDISAVGWVAGGVTVGSIITLTFITGGLAGVIAGGIVGGTASGTGYYFLAPVIEGESGNDFIPPMLIEANSEEFNALKCKEIATSA